MAGRLSPRPEKLAAPVYGSVRRVLFDFDSGAAPKICRLSVCIVVRCPAADIRNASYEVMLMLDVNTFGEITYNQAFVD